MGTNYYLKCKCCGTEVFHIGKQSAGWPFASDYTEEEIKSKMASNKALKIYDEYNHKYTWLQFRNRITSEWHTEKHDCNPMDWC
jgi:hypothetical protein